MGWGAEVVGVIMIKIKAGTLRMIVTCEAWKKFKGRGKMAWKRIMMKKVPLLLVFLVFQSSVDFLESNRDAIK